LRWPYSGQCIRGLNVDLNPLNWFEHGTQAVLQNLVIHLVLPIVLFILAFATLVFGKLPMVVRVVLAAILAGAGLYLGGWLPW
jgi:heme/copper-type cytochrome/quinol oxidase subunit 4